MSAVPLRNNKAEARAVRSVSVLGATGSIGDSTMDLLRASRDRYRVEALTANTNVQGLAKLTSKDDVVAALANSFTAAHKAVATLTVANAFEVIKSPEPGFATRATLAGFLISHANDHYGQMVEYLRMNGLVPPASAK